MNRFKNYIAILLIVAGTILFMFYQNDLASNKSTQDQLRKMKRAIESADSLESGSSYEIAFIDETINDTVVPSEVPFEPIDVFHELHNNLTISETNPLYDFFLENDDFVSWITIPDTRIDYPIVKMSDNDFYLDHDFYGQPSKAGSIFMDYRNVGDGSDKHTIIYGHKMKNKTMFYDLLRFRDPEFYQATRILTLETLRGPLYYKVFAAYTTGTDFYFINTRFDEAAHAQFIQDIKARTDHEWDTEVHFSNKILTLATCSHDFKDSRYVVHAVLIENPSDFPANMIPPNK